MVDPDLGFPRGYGKLCKQACIRECRVRDDDDDDGAGGGDEAEMNKLKEFDGLFPHVNDEEKDFPNARQHAEILWQELDHLGNAGFDPLKFRVDLYGNVVYWHADSGSPLAWEVDHWFPYSRGGKTVISNLRIVQWQAHERKGTNLEFLVPRSDLQIGISVCQFLSVFSSKNADFRKRAFSLFFRAGENDEDAVKCHSWPQDFQEKKSQVGLAAAAIVKVHKALDDTLRVLNENRPTKQVSHGLITVATPARKRWTSDEEEALRKAVQKFGPGNWKDIKEFEPMLVNRSTVQIKDKYRLMKGEWKLDKENQEVARDRLLLVSITLQKEERIKQTVEKEKKQKEEELALLVDQIKQLSIENEKEKFHLEELERALANEKNRRKVERKWAETQAEYKLCLEKMIEDTMHQCDAYKEETKLNNAACNALRARLEARKAACDAAEVEFVKAVKEKESLQNLVRPETIKSTVNEGCTDMEACSTTQIARKEREPKTLRPVERESEIDHDKTDDLFGKDKHDQDVPESMKEFIPVEDDISDLCKEKGIAALSEEGYESPEEFLHAQGEAHLSTKVPCRPDMAVIPAFENDTQCIRETGSDRMDKNASAPEMQENSPSMASSNRSSRMKRIVLENKSLETEKFQNNGEPDNFEDNIEDNIEVLRTKGMVRTTMIDNIEDAEDETDAVSHNEEQEDYITVTRGKAVTESESHVSDNIVCSEEKGSITVNTTVETHAQHPPYVIESNILEAEEVTSGYNSIPHGFLKKLKLKVEKGEVEKVYMMDVIRDDMDEGDETDANTSSHVQNTDHYTNKTESNVAGSQKIPTGNSMLGGLLKKLNLKHNKTEDEEDLTTSLFKSKKGNVEKVHNHSHEKHGVSPWRHKASSSLPFKRFASVNGTTGLFLRQKSRGPSDIKDGKVEDTSYVSSFSGLKQRNQRHDQDDAGKGTEQKAFLDMEEILSMGGGKIKELTVKLPRKSEEILPTLRDVLDDSCLSSSLQGPMDCKESLPSSEASSRHRLRATNEESCSSSSSSRGSVDCKTPFLLKESSSFSPVPMNCSKPSLFSQSSSSSSSSSSSVSPQFEAQLEPGRLSSSSSSSSVSPECEAQVEPTRALPSPSPSKLQTQLEPTSSSSPLPSPSPSKILLARHESASSSSPLPSPLPSKIMQAQLEQASSSSPLPSPSPSKIMQAQLEPSEEGQEKSNQQDKQHLWLSLLKAQINLMNHSQRCTMVAETQVLQKHEEGAATMLSHSKGSHQANLNDVISEVEKESGERRARGVEEKDEGTSRAMVKEEERELETKGAMNASAMAPLKKHWDATLSHVWRKAVKKFDLAVRHP